MSELGVPEVVFDLPVHIRYLNFVCKSLFLNITQFTVKNMSMKKGTPYDIKKMSQTISFSFLDTMIIEGTSARAISKNKYETSFENNEFSVKIAVS